jgi:glyoxylase-like metal-dependent hydrolase (beta-lactamase superfamily II)
VQEVAPGVFVATAEPYVTTTTVVAGADGGCLVIDPAVTVAELDAIAAWLSAHGLRPVAGWSTHPHWDHLLWSRSLGDVPRYATPRAAEVAARELARMAGRVEKEAPGHDLALFARVAPLSGEVIGWRGPSAVVLAHDAHAPGHGAVFLPEVGVLVAGDMCSDIEMPLLDTEPAGGDPFGGYRHGLGVLASVRGVRVVVPGHGHPGDAAEFRRRVTADFAYLDAVEAGRDVADERLASAPRWLLAEHARQRALGGGEPTSPPSPEQTTG